MVTGILITSVFAVCLPDYCCRATSFPGCYGRSIINTVGGMLGHIQTLGVSRTVWITLRGEVNELNRWNKMHSATYRIIRIRSSRCSTAIPVESVILAVAAKGSGFLALEVVAQAAVRVASSSSAAVPKYWG